MSGADRVIITYKSDADMFLQLRHDKTYSGGHHYRIALESTGGVLTQVEKLFADFAQPPDASEIYPLDLSDAQAFSFVATSSVDLTVTSLRIPGFTPNCNPDG